MHQTQTFVHLIILLLPRARLTPLRTPDFEINGHHNTLEDSSRYSASCRPATRFLKEFSANLPICPKSEMPVCSRLQRRNQTHARSQCNRRRGAYEIVRLEKPPPSPRSRLCPGDLFIPVVSVGVSRPEPGDAARHRASSSRSNRGPTRRNSSQSRELGRQCDLSCRSGAGGGHGRRLLFPITPGPPMGRTHHPPPVHPSAPLP